MAKPKVEREKLNPFPARFSAEEREFLDRESYRASVPINDVIRRAVQLLKKKKAS